MFDETARAFLQKPLIARMCTIDPEGYPHIVPVWFMLDGDEIVIISVPDTRKVGHIKANPKGAIQVGGDAEDEAGYLLKGEFTLEDDPGGTWMKKLTYHYEPPEKAAQDVEAWKDLGILVIRLKPCRVIKVA